jgi:hypothetical protein
MQPKTSDLRSIVAHTGVFSTLCNGSDGAVDNNLIVSSSKDVVLSAPTGNVVATTDKFVLLSGSHAARMLISDSNELVFELKDDTSGSFLPVARFATTI